MILIILILLIQRIVTKALAKNVLIIMATIQTSSRTTVNIYETYLFHQE